MAEQQKNIRIPIEYEEKWKLLEKNGYSLTQILKDGIDRCYNEWRANNDSSKIPENPKSDTKEA